MIPEIELQMYFNGLRRDILEAQIAYLQNTRPFRSYIPIAVATRLRGYVEYPAASKLLPLA